MFGYVLITIAATLFAVGVINWAIMKASTRKPKEDKYDFDEEDCYNGKFDRERNRFRRKDT